MSSHDENVCMGNEEDVTLEDGRFKPAGSTHLVDAKPPDSEIEPEMLYEGVAGAMREQAALPDPTDKISLSPNRTKGMPSGGWKGVTIHFEAGYHQPSVNWLRDPRSQASAHFCVRRDGFIEQLVYESDRAWHAKTAGMSYLGIEHEGGPPAPYYWTTPADALSLRSDDKMLIESAKLTAYLCSKYGLTAQWDTSMPARRDTNSVIAGHDQMSGNTHWDPGAKFPRKAYLKRVKELMGGSTPTPPQPPTTGPNYRTIVDSTKDPAQADKNRTLAVSRGYKDAWTLKSPA